MAPRPDETEPNPRSEIKVLVSLTESSIMESLEDSVTQFTAALGTLTRDIEGVRDSLNTLASGAGGGRGGGGGGSRHRHPGASGDDSSDSGSRFVPYDNFFQEVMGRHGRDQTSQDIMAQGFQMPRFGSWTIQDYMAHLGYLSSRLAYRVGRDPASGQADYMMDFGGQTQAVGEFLTRIQDPTSLTDEQREQLTAQGVYDEHGNLNRQAAYRFAMNEAQGSGGAARVGAAGSRWFMGAARAAPLISTSAGVAQTLLQRLPQTLAGPSRMGMEMGLERTDSTLPFGLGSTAAVEFFSGIRDAFTASLPGFLGGHGGYLTMGEGQEINAAIHRMGYSRGDRERMFDVIGDVRASTGANIDLTAIQMDAAIRHGAMSLEAFREEMLLLPDAANAARMNMQEFQTQLHAAATALSQQGLTYGEGQQITRSISRATGLRPEDAAELAQNQYLSILGANRRGMTWGQYLDDPETRAEGSVMGPAEMFRLVTGRELNEQGVRDPNARQLIRQLYATGQGDQLFGMDFQQLMVQGLAGPEEMAASAAASAGIDELYNQVTAADGKTIDFGNVNESASDRSRMERHVRGLLDRAVTGDERQENKQYRDFIDDLANQRFDTPTEMLEAAQEVIARDTEQRVRHEEGQVGIALQGYAEDILRQVIKDNGGSVAGTANTASRGTDWGDRATSAGKAALMYNPVSAPFTLAAKALF